MKIYESLILPKIVLDQSVQPFLRILDTDKQTDTRPRLTSKVFI